MYEYLYRERLVFQYTTRKHALISGFGRDESLFAVTSKASTTMVTTDCDYGDSDADCNIEKRQNDPKQATTNENVFSICLPPNVDAV